MGSIWAFPKDKVATAGLHNGTWPATDDATDTNLDTSKVPTYSRYIIPYSIQMAYILKITHLNLLS